MSVKRIHALVLGWVGVSIAMLGGASVSHADTVASLLGNFTINQYCGLNLARNAVDVHYAVVYGQLPALRELHLADADGNGVTSQTERDTYVGTLAPGFADGLELVVDGLRVPLRPIRWTSSLPTEQGGFSLRVDVDLTAALPMPTSPTQRTMRFANHNFGGRMGWHEIVVNPASDVAVFATDAYDDSATSALTEAVQALPEGGPLDERSVHLSFADAMPQGMTAIGPRLPSGSPVTQAAVNPSTASPGASDTAWISRSTRHLIDVISAPRLDPRVAIWALLAALLLGAVHALSPGHGKTIVGAYLIGSRGTPRHAVFLGFTVTVTHTIGVFVLGFATLYASRFVVPERLFPILSLISALLVLGMGIFLLVQRGRIATRSLKLPTGITTIDFVPFEAATAGSHNLILAHGHAHFHDHADGTMHSHGGGKMHSHLPPGASGERVTWKSLLTLGISGGLVPCPSAMVLLLAAIALNKTAYGMLLVLVFSLGLAITLTIVGLAFLYARNRFLKPRSSARWPALLPVLSAATITVVGAVLCFGAVKSFAL